MSVPLRVLGDRVLVRPDVNSNAPVELESGIVIAKSLAAAVTGEDPTSSVHRGTVVGLGNPQHPLHEEVTVLADRFEAYAGVTDYADWLRDMLTDGHRLLRDLVRRNPCVGIGDDVLFSHDAGQEVVIESERLIILHEHELLAVVE